MQDTRHNTWHKTTYKTQDTIQDTRHNTRHKTRNKTNDKTQDLPTLLMPIKGQRKIKDQMFKLILKMFQTQDYLKHEHMLYFYVGMIQFVLLYKGLILRIYIIANENTFYLSI